MMNDCIQPMPSLTDPAVADPEAALLKQALRGDGRAFATLVRPHLSMLYRVAAREARNEALAEDAVQEALVIVHERLDRYRPNTSFKAWIAAIVVNRARTLARGERRRAAREESAHAPQPLPGPSAALSADALACLLYTSPSPRDKRQSRMPSSA